MADKQKQPDASQAGPPKAKAPPDQPQQAPLKEKSSHPQQQGPREKPSPQQPPQDGGNERPRQQKQPPTDRPRPTPSGGNTSSNPRFSVTEMIDLALCSPEVGAVNFNILRILLRDMALKTGIDKSHVQTNDLEAHQVENFKNYVQGTAVASPMPGVLRIGPGQTAVAAGGGAPPPQQRLPPGAGPGGPPGGQRTPRTPKTGLPPAAGVSSLGLPTGASGPFSTDPNMDLSEKVARLEKHLEALYELPANSELLDKAKVGNTMSVSDMWQIIQLNNRIAAAEAAIQKMASLIEDLAKNMGKVKVETKVLKKGAEELTSTNSDLLIQSQNLADQYDKYADVIQGIKTDIEQLKRGWKKDRDNLEKTLGVNLGTVPSFMKPKQRKEKETGQDITGETPSEMFDRGTQTFVKIEKDQPDERQRQRERGERGERGGDRREREERGERGWGKGERETERDERRRERGDREGERDERRRERGDREGERGERRGERGAEWEERGGREPSKPKKAPEKFIPPKKIAEMTADEIAREVTAEEVRTIPQEIYKDMTPEQKKAIQDIRNAAKKGEVRKRPLGVNNMTKEQLNELSPETILEKMTFEEAVNIPPEVLENMTDEQKASVKKTIDRGPPPKRPTSRKDLKKQEEGQQGGQGPVKGKTPLGIASMSEEELRKVTPSEIINSMPYEEAINIPASVLKQMTNEQQAAVKKVINQGPPKTKKGDAPPLRKAMGLASMNQQELQEVEPAEIAAKMGFEEAKGLPPSVLEKMTKEQQAAVRRVVNEGQKRSLLPSNVQQMGVVSMTEEQLKELEPDQIINRMSFEEAKTIPHNVLEKMTTQQREAIKSILSVGPGATGQKLSVGISYMTKDELGEISPEDIKKQMGYNEAKNIPKNVFDKLTDEQKAAVKAIVEEGPPPQEPEDEEYDDEYDDYVDTYESGEPYQQKLQQQKQRKMSREKRKSDVGRKSLPITPEEVEELAQMTPRELAKSMTPEMAASIPHEVLQSKFTEEQVKEIQKLKEEATVLDMEKTADMTPSELVSSLTPEQITNLSEDQLELLTEDQQEAVIEARKTILERELTESAYQEEFTDYQDRLTADEFVDAEGDEGSITGSGSRKGPRGKPAPKRDKGKHHHHHHKHRREEKSEEAGDKQKHTKIDVVQGPIPTVGEPLPPLSLEDYLASLPPEEAANLAADAVQRELQKQYQQLQGMQKQLAQDIQEKMEFIYQKLLREIVSQQLTTSPYMAVGGPEQCLGPGICTGHGMPAGIAVVQFPEAKDKAMVPAGTAGEVGDIRVCPGPPVCPGKDICPYCRAGGKEGLESLKGLEKKHAEGPVSTALAITDGHRITELDESVIQEMRSLMLLDLEKIREEMRTRKLGNYDEQDILERLGAVWEALKILKHNEEAIAIKISKQDAFFKKLPTKTLEKLSKIPEENLDAITTGNFSKPMYIPEDSAKKHSFQKEAEEFFNLPHAHGHATHSGGGGGADKEDIQTLFNNLANVIAECTEQKDRIDQLADTARILESGMVTKQMLMDALSDKADRGLINTKVSYDEFGNTIDELHNQLHNLMVEGYQRNENWKKVTADLAEELADKLDKVELAPIRAFFKNHLKTLEEKVKKLTQLIEEPDPAGTRKKLLRDYNCISCDRSVNISGVTNGPTLPAIGPIKAGHPTASKRALDLHRLRMQRQFDINTKNLNALERHGKNLSNKAQRNISDPEQIANDVDVMHVVNRYTGGSHTAINNAERISAQRGQKKGNAMEELFESTTRNRNSDTGAPPVTSSVGSNPMNASKTSAGAPPVSNSSVRK